MSETYLSIGQVADAIAAAEGCTIPPWKIGRLYEMRLLPAPSHVGGRRAIPQSHLPLIVAAMRERGWLPQAEAAAV